MAAASSTLFTTLARLCFFLGALLPLVAALQVTPNSPCSSVCIDSASLDKSDPNSSNTGSKDISCDNGQFENEGKGQKFKTCMNCLQNSNFTQGSEDDQSWFLYNLRYSFDYCVFGYPNNTQFGANPCMTSEACGGIQSALKNGIPDPPADQYAYCDVDGGSMTGVAYEKCLQCVKADSTRSYMSNFLVALEMACKVKPAIGSVIGLNATVFSNVTISIADPIISVAAQEGFHLPTAAIAGIAVGAFVLLSVAIGCVFMQIRKRKNRSTRSKRVRASSLSFRCKDSALPSELGFHDEYEYDDRFFTQEKPRADPSAALGSNPVTEKELSSADYGATRANMPAKPMAIITTTLPLPSPALTSPRYNSPDDYKTPLSTTSTRSNAPLLNNTRSFPPPQYSNSPILHPAATFSDSSPRITQSGWAGEIREPESPWEQQDPSSSNRELVKKKSQGRMGTPTEVQRLQLSFPPPPKR